MKTTIDALVEALEPVATWMEQSANCSSGGPDHPPEPTSQFDYELIQAASEIRAALAQARAEQAEPVAVAFLDIGAGGYVDLGSDLTDGQLAELPLGRHALAIVGTFGVDGYAPTAPPAAPVAKLEPLNDREIELIDGMIGVQLHHAAQCDGIANRTMATKQKGWDMERVELLRKLKAAHNAKMSK